MAGDAERYAAALSRISKSRFSVDCPLNIFMKMCLHLFLLFLLAFPVSFAHPQSQVAFRIEDRELIPEGIAYDPVGRTFYLGSTFRRKIISLDSAGNARDFTAEAQDGIRGVLGLRVDARRRVLWAISSHAGLTMPISGNPRDCLGCSSVFKYDLRTGRLIKRYDLGNTPRPHFLNDLTISPAGDVYITDTVGGSIYQISRRRDELELLVTLGERVFPNGIDLSDNGQRLFVAVAGGIMAIELRSRRVFRIEIPGGISPVIDGLYFYRNSLIAIQPFERERKIARYFLNRRLDTITRMTVIESDQPLMNQPTTGVLVGSSFYYIANSQLQLFRSIYNPSGTYDRDRLSGVAVLRLNLETPRTM